MTFEKSSLLTFVVQIKAHYYQSVQNSTWWYNLVNIVWVIQLLKKIYCDKTPVLHFDRRVLLHRLLLSLWVRTAPVPGKQDEILYGRNEIANGVPCDLVHTMYQTFFAFKMSCDQTVHACFLLDCHKERSTFPGPILTKLPNTQKTLRFRTKSFALIGIS